MKECKFIIQNCYGKYLYNGPAFKDWLLQGFYENKEKSTEENYFSSIERIIKQEDKSSNESLNIENEFNSSIILDFDFAEKLNLYDVINPHSLDYIRENGKKLIKIAADFKIVFIVTEKYFLNKNSLIITLEACNYIFKDECLYNIQGFTT